MKLFRVSVSTNRIDNVVTIDPAQQCTHDTRKVCAILWMIETFHREVKQLTDIEKCPCGKQRIQRNHVACAVLVCGSLKQITYETGQTVYPIKQNLLKNYRIEQLKYPEVDMSFA